MSTLFAPASYSDTMIYSSIKFYNDVKEDVIQIAQYSNDLQQRDITYKFGNRHKLELVNELRPILRTAFERNLRVISTHNSGTPNYHNVSMVLDGYVNFSIEDLYINSNLLLLDGNRS